MENYMLEAGNHLYEMRLITEGAIRLWENEAQPAIYLIPKNERGTAVLALDTIIAAMYTLQKKVRQMQTDHQAERLRQDNEAVRAVK